jgi:L-galactose dehydrogenase
LKQQGLVRHIGITGLPLNIFRDMLSRVEDNAFDTCLSYCHYCLNDRSLLELLPDLEARGLGIVNASCLSMGLLTAAGPPEWHPAPAELREAARAASELCSSQGHDLSRLALMWAVKVLLLP